VPAAEISTEPHGATIYYSADGWPNVRPDGEPASRHEPKSKHLICAAITHPVIAFLSSLMGNGIVFSSPSSLRHTYLYICIYLHIISSQPLWTHESPERAAWEWRRVKRSFRAKKCDRIIHDLRNWNDDLRHLINNAETLPDDDSHAVRRVRRLYNRSNCESVRGTLQSLYRALQNGLSGDGAQCHQVCIELNSLHAGGFPLLTFRIGIQHEPNKSQASPSPWKLFYAAGEAVKEDSGAISPPISLSRPSTLRSRRSTYSQGLRDRAHSIWSKSRESFAFVKQLPTPRASVEDASITSATPILPKCVTIRPRPITNLCEKLEAAPTGEVFGSIKDRLMSEYFH
jgi:hypothetical protein